MAGYLSLQINDGFFAPRHSLQNLTQISLDQRLSNTNKTATAILHITYRAQIR